MTKLKYLLSFSVIVFILTSIHLGYQYIVFSSDKISSKGGTVIEGTITQIAYLPYLSMSKSDKWYQHLLFRGCIMMGSGSQLTGDLCDITTTDNKTYTIGLRPGSIWSDGTPITINDIYFTYYDIIKSNKRGLSFLDSYNKLGVAQNDNGTIAISFPRESVDNQLFFLNPILPAHLLTSQNLAYYQRNFAASPITSACASLKPQSNDKSSVIFDLTRCTQYNPQILQVKQFDSNSGLQSYIDKNPGVIDYVIDGTSSSLTQHGVTSTQAVIAYFHVNTLSDASRRQMGLLFNNVIDLPEVQLPGFVKYQGMFDLPGSVDWTLLKRNLGLSPTASTGDTNTGTRQTTTTQNDIPVLTKNMLAYGSNKYRTAYLPAQEKHFTVSLKFDEAYDKIAISANGPYKYFPESYNKDTKSADYNLSTAFNNLKIGKNTYTVWGYKGDQAIEVLNLTLYYIDKPSAGSSDSTNTVVTNLDGTRNIRVIYVKHPVIDVFVEQLKMLAGWNQMEGNMSFVSVDSVADLDETISSKAYEVIIKPIDLGARNDLSILVHDDPMINNAQYKNVSFKNFLTELNSSPEASRANIIRSIQQIYRQDVPFVLLGNTMEYFYSIPSIERSAAPTDTIATVREALINKVRASHTLNINKGLLYNPNHLIKFLIGNHAG